MGASCSGEVIHVPQLADSGNAANSSITGVSKKGYLSVETLTQQWPVLEHLFRRAESDPQITAVQRRER
jgi:hypothetical protein